MSDLTNSPPPPNVHGALGVTPEEGAKKPWRKPTIYLLTELGEISGSPTNKPTGGAPGGEVEGHPDPYQVNKKYRPTPTE